MKRMCWLLGAVVAAGLFGCGGSSGGQPAYASIQSPEPEPESVTACIPGALAAEDPGERARCLVRVIGDDDLMSQIDLESSLQAKVAQRMEPLGQDRVDAMSAEITRLFAAESLQAQFEAKIAAAFDDAQGRTLLEYYATDVGTRYADGIAHEASSRETQEWIEANPVSDARRAQLEALAASQRLPEFMRALLVEPATSMVRALAPDAPNATITEQTAKIEAMLVPMLEELQTQMTGQLGYLTRDLDDAELASAIEMERGPQAQWMLSLRLESLRAVMSDAYSGLGRAIAEQTQAGRTSK